MLYEVLSSRFTFGKIANKHIFQIVELFFKSMVGFHRMIFFSFLAKVFPGNLVLPRFEYKTEMMEPRSIEFLEAAEEIMKDVSNQLSLLFFISIS